MKFNFISIENEEKGMQPEVLTFNEAEDCWYGDDGTRYEKCAAGNAVPISINDDLYEWLPGYFVVEVTDPNGVKGTFKLYAANELVSSGYSSFLYPGATCDDQEVGKKLEAAGFARPDMDFDFLPHTICYGFNDGPAVDGTMELEPWDEEGTGDYDPAAEQAYVWRII